MCGGACAADNVLLVFLHPTIPIASVVYTQIEELQRMRSFWSSNKHFSFSTCWQGLPYIYKFYTETVGNFRFQQAKTLLQVPCQSNLKMPSFSSHFNHSFVLIDDRASTSVRPAFGWPTPTLLSAESSQNETVTLEALRCLSIRSNRPFCKLTN